MYKKLTIVSDSALSIRGKTSFGFSSVVNEIEFFEEKFESIVWIGADYTNFDSSSLMQEIINPKIKLIFIPRLGGKKIINVFEIFLYYPILFFIILKNIYNSDVIHTRAPSHASFIAVMISFFFKSKVWWHKFAGDWNESTLPFFYRFQRNMLIKSRHSKVTINGFWHDQPTHCLSFENPCLSLNEIEIGESISKNKNFNIPFVFTFVGRLDSEKGVDEIIEALKTISFDSIDKVHFVGNGENLEYYRNETLFLKEKVVFHGFLEKTQVHEILKQAHFFLLPSKSEGFPKVIAEACCYGAIPIVSNVGSISHYVNNLNGFVWKIKSNENFSLSIQKAINSNSISLKEKSIAGIELAKKFTFVNYVQKLEQIF